MALLWCFKHALRLPNLLLSELIVIVCAYFRIVEAQSLLYIHTRTLRKVRQSRLICNHYCSVIHEFSHVCTTCLRIRPLPDGFLLLRLRVAYLLIDVTSICLDGGLDLVRDGILFGL
jgi:hypothetical protein